MKKLTIWMTAAMMLMPVGIMAKSKKKPQQKQPSTLEIIDKVNDYYQQHQKPQVRAFWDDAAYFTGNMEAYRLTGHARFLEYSDKWARHNRWSGATEPVAAKWKYKQYGESQQHALFGDWQICFQTYLDMYEINPDAYKIKRAKEVMDYECATAANDYWWWADALYMVMPVMTKLYKATGDVKYLDKLYANFKYADDLMFDPETHLYFRDGKYIYPKHKTESGKKDFWARGDGWVLAGLAKVLTDMPLNYPHRDFFVQRFLQLAKAVSECQQKQGYWTRSMLDPDQAEGPETSGTAFFTYGLLWGMNHGLLDRATYEPVVNRSWNYLVDTALQPDGSVGYVQPIGEKAIKGQQLSGKNTANFGTGAFLLAACEKVRFDDATVNPTDTKAFKVVVSNDGDSQRQEVIELDAKTVYSRLGISGGRQFFVTNPMGQQMAYQLTHDGKVLVEVSVRPHHVATFTVAKGVPETFVNTCYGRIYPERLDDVAWENDRGAYRCYGPALQRKGEKSYGYDIWTKNTPDLVVEQRYYDEQTGWPRVNAMKKVDKKAAEDIHEKFNYHLDHGRGLDCYAVGPTLGCGTPALLEGDRIIFPYCYKDYVILDNGPLRFTVRLTYNAVKIGACDSVVEHRIVSLDKGSNFNKTTVWYEGLSGQPVDFASGVVIHSADTEHVVLGDRYVAYADPTDVPDGHNMQLYVGAIFPEGNVETRKIMNAESKDGNAGHALGVVKGFGQQAGSRCTYYFGSAWSKYDCRTQDDWLRRIHDFSAALNSPLKVTME